jgi:hypothetical protein
MRAIGPLTSPEEARMLRNPVVAATMVLALALAACGGGGGGPTGSNHVWVSDSNANAVYGWSFDQLAATGVPSPDVGVGTGASSMPYDLAMGPGSSLWVALPGKNLVARFDAGQLTSSGTPAPAATVAAAAADHLTFDRAGNLWITQASAARTILRFAKSDVSGKGALTPAASLTLSFGTTGAASDALLDPGGHLWLIDKGNGSSIAPTYMRAPDTVLTATGTATLTPEVSFGTSGQIFAQGQAFDAGGALWVATLNTGSTAYLNRYGASQVAASGTKDPEARITVTGGVSLGSLAFDASGALWIADYSGRKLLHVPASQLVGSGVFTVNPDVVITAPSASGVGLSAIVVDPTPDGLPLAY